jgi:hypothetical protein
VVWWLLVRLGDRHLHWGDSTMLKTYSTCNLMSKHPGVAAVCWTALFPSLLANDVASVKTSLREILQLDPIEKTAYTDWFMVLPSPTALACLVCKQ